MMIIVILISVVLVPVITVKTLIKEQVFWWLRLILLLYIGCFLKNQPENVLKASLKLFL